MWVQLSKVGTTLNNKTGYNAIKWVQPYSTDVDLTTRWKWVQPHSVEYKPKQWIRVQPHNVGITLHIGSNCTLDEGSIPLRGYDLDLIH